MGRVTSASAPVTATITMRVDHFRVILVVAEMAAAGIPYQGRMNFELLRDAIKDLETQLGSPA